MIPQFGIVQQGPNSQHAIWSTESRHGKHFYFYLSCSYMYIPEFKHALDII